MRKKIEKLPHVTVKAPCVDAVKSGYPWITRADICTIGEAANGDIVKILSSKNEFLAIGYYNGLSNIALRVLTLANEHIDQGFFTAKIAAAYKKREAVIKNNNACRVFFSEADGIPGLIIDLYADTVVMQVLTLGIDRIKENILEAINTVIKPLYTLERSDSPIRQEEGLPLIKNWHGKTGLEKVKINENGIIFCVDIINGHKTGFYLDQRKARQSLKGFCKNKKVLDLFSYCGGFAISAAVFGAKEVTAVDIKNEWLEMGRENARLNRVDDKINFIKADVFDFLRDTRANGTKFDLIILDPPSFLKNKSELADAIRGYRELNLSAMKILNDGGTLATFSCSHNMPFEAFAHVVKTSARMAKKEYTILKRCRQDIDHPFVKNIPQTDYLKGYFLKIDPKQ